MVVYVCFSDRLCIAIKVINLDLMHFLPLPTLFAMTMYTFGGWKNHAEHPLNNTCRPIQKMQSPVSGGCHIQRRSLCRSFDKPFYVNLCGNRMMQHHNSTLVEGFIDLNQSHSGSKMSSNPPGTNQGHCLSKCALCQRHGSWNDVCKQIFSVSSLIWQIVGCCCEGVTCCFVLVSRSLFAILCCISMCFPQQKTCWYCLMVTEWFTDFKRRTCAISGNYW